MERSGGGQRVAGPHGAGGAGWALFNSLPLPLPLSLSLSLSYHLIRPPSTAMERLDSDLTTKFNWIVPLFKIPAPRVCSTARISWTPTTSIIARFGAIS